MNIRELATALLARVMSDISERCYCAGWMRDTEYVLWHLAQQGGGDYGMWDVSAAEAAHLTALSDLAGGWVVWDDPKTHEEWIALDEWEPRFQAWFDRSMAR